MTTIPTLDRPSIPTDRPTEDPAPTFRRRRRVAFGVAGLLLAGAGLAVGLASDGGDDDTTSWAGDWKDVVVVDGSGAESADTGDWKDLLVTG